MTRPKDFNLSKSICKATGCRRKAQIGRRYCEGHLKQRVARNQAKRLKFSLGN